MLRATIVKHKYSVFSYCIILAVGVLSGCNNSNYDDSPDDSQKPNTTSLNVTLDGSQQVPQPVQTPATGTAEFVIETRVLNSI